MALSMMSVPTAEIVRVLRCARLTPMFAALFSLVLTLTSAGVAASDNRNSVSHYALGSGDSISIQVYGEADMSLPQARLSDAGTISMAYLGEISVEGMTIGELEAHITESLRGDYLINPRVNVSILEYRQFYVNGEVESPGGFPFMPGLTISKAIAIAGGLTDRASRDKIYVESDKGERRRMKMGDVVTPGDIITVEQSFF